MYRYEVSIVLPGRFPCPSFSIVLVLITLSLALCELYLVTALFTLRAFPRMQLYDTKYEDIAYDHDDQVPRPKSGSRGVRVTIS